MAALKLASPLTSGFDTRPRMLHVHSSSLSSSSLSSISTPTTGSFTTRRAPTPLNLTYAINKNPSKNGGPLISPVHTTLTRGNSIDGSSPRRPPSPSPFLATSLASRSPRTPPFSVSGSGSDSTGLGRRRPSNERSPNSGNNSSLSFASRRYSMPSEAEQDNFERLCKLRFYEQDVDATYQVERLLKTSSATAQSCYNKILSNVRQQYHKDVTLQRQEALQRVMTEAAPDLDMTKDDRRARLKCFLEVYASKELIGTHPFLKGLYTLIYLQTVKESKGGAGGKCLEWLLLDEVFMEAGTGQWTKESVVLLKTVLAMTDVTQQERDLRSPFVSQNRRTSSSSREHTVSAEERPEYAQPDLIPSRLRGETLSEGSIRRLRMPPHLGNPELCDLLAAFPSWITQSRAREYRFETLVGMSLPESPSAQDLEAVLPEPKEKRSSWGKLRISHGHLQISPEDRHLGFEGTLVERVTGWFRRFFGTV